ncbi:MAG: sigma-54 dependent transcriptional regulator [Gammaproteobacteria bacterium]|nr:sigma-54 dependent transcriptional regulator [Gammaproteobacteria bacterium]
MNAFEKLIGESAEFKSVLRSAEIVAATDVTVLIEGETGTGKELLAQAIHESSSRNNKPFVTINCAALPESLVESELFGHKKGSFTGAVSDHPGYIKQAEGGTVFLDEIGELPLSVQAKLLRFIEYGECQCVGDAIPHNIDVRLVAATNRNIAEQVKKGLFREDLYYRLKIVPLELPSLKKREKDILLIVNYFIASLAEQYGKAKPRFTSSALKQLQNYSWPGNVRELRNLCERLVVLLAGQEITETNLPVDIVSSDTSSSGFKLPLHGLNLEYLEMDLLKQALGVSGGNKSRAARLLGISRDAFLYRLKKYSI